MHSAGGPDLCAGLGTDEAVRWRGYGERGIHRMNEERDGLSSLIGRAGPKQHHRHAPTGGHLVLTELQDVGLSNPTRRRFQPEGSSERLREPPDVEFEDSNVLESERKRVTVPRVVAAHCDDAAVIVADDTTRAVDAARARAPDALDQGACLPEQRFCYRPLIAKQPAPFQTFRRRARQDLKRSPEVPQLPHPLLGPTA